LKRCPGCRRKLKKSDVALIVELDMTQGGKVIAKIAQCRFCGKELGRRDFT